MNDLPKMTGDSPRHSRASQFMIRCLASLCSLQVARPSVVLLVCGLLTALGLGLASRLTLKTEFDQLLPESQKSVIELHRVAARVAGVSNLFIVLEGNDTKTLRKFGDALVPKLQAIGHPWVGASEDGVQAARNFLLPRASFFASLQDLSKLRDDLKARWDYEVSKKLETDLGLEDDQAPPALDAKSVKGRFSAGPSEIADHFPDGYFQSPDGKSLIVAVHAAIPAGDLPRSKETLEKVTAVVETLHQTPEFASVHVGYTGDLATSLNEYGAIRDDLVEVGVIGVFLVLGVVLLYYLRLRTWLVLGLTISAGCAWTFGATQLVIGHLNVATGFLISIVAGNGINFGIIYLARYLEERRSGSSVDLAILTTHHQTWLQTLTAALAAAAAYGSLGVTDFRGFKHFAIIGSIGMILCWIATYTALPAILVVSEKLSPFDSGKTSRFARLRRAGANFDAPFAWLVQTFPRALSLIGVTLAVAGLVLSFGYIKNDPMEYDMKHVRNDVRSRAEQLRLTALSSDIVGEANASAMAIVVDRLEQVEPLKRTLELRRDTAPVNAKPFAKIHTVLDFVPEKQVEKLPVVNEIRDLLSKARSRGLVNDDDWAGISPLLPPKDFRPFDLAALPPDLTRPFTERDGTVGRIVFIEPTAGQDVDDVHYLIRWADSFRATTLPNGEVILGSGRAVIYADMLRTIVSDAPKAVFVSLLATAFVVLLTFRRGGHTIMVLGTLLVGVAWLGGVLALFGVKLNFLNFVALPITFGIGVDYAVNVVQRYAQDGSKGVLAVVKSTGGAVVLCSLTTTLGYLALLRSLNQAVRSMGIAAVLGELCCLLAAVLVLPAILLWRERRSPATLPALAESDSAQ